MTDTTQTTKNRKPDLGRIGKLADDIRFAAREVIDDMIKSPAGDAYTYQGSTSAVDSLIDAINALEHFQAGWK
jgi:hypothetical protein